MNTRFKQRGFELLVLLVAAALEVGGDALIRRGLRGGGLVSIALGFVILGTYGLVVNLLQLDFSRLLGVYIGVFAVLAVLTGRFVFREQVSPSTWIGLLVVIAGSLIIQVGSSFH